MEAADLSCAGVAVGAATISVLLLRRKLGPTTPRPTSVIGWQSVHGVEITGLYTRTFELIVVGGPIITLVLFALFRSALSAFWPESRLPKRPWLPVGRRTPPPPRRDVSPLSSPRWVMEGALSLVVPGAVLGLELAVGRRAEGDAVLAYAALGAGAYAVAVVAGAVVVAQVPIISGLASNRRSALAMANAFGICFAVAGTHLVSVGSFVRGADGTVHAYDWLQLRTACGLAISAAAVVTLSLWRRPQEPERARLVERRAVLLVTVPTLLFLLTSAMFNPGPAPMPAFEFGLQADTLRFLQHGLVPWRDFYTDHGLLEDTLRLIPGFQLVEPTSWGMYAGVSLLIAPLTVISLYSLVYRAAKASCALIIAFLLLLLNTSALSFQSRFLLWPVLLVALWSALDRGVARYAAMVGGGVVLSAVLTPEAAYGVVAVGVAVIAHDLYLADLSRGARLQSFRLTLGLAAGGAAVALALIIVLLATRSLSGFVNYYIGSVPGHAEVGGIPLSLARPLQYLAVLPVLALLYAAATLAVKLRLRIRLGNRDYVLMAASVFALLYYPKALDRADAGHFQQVYAEAVPLFVIIATSAIDAADSALRRLLRRRASPRVASTAWGAVAVATVTGTVSVPAGLAAIPARFQVASSIRAPQWRSQGWFAAQEPMYTDVQKLLALYLSPGDRLFDFTDSPGVPYAVLGYLPATRVATVASASNGPSQGSLVSELDRARPKVIVYWASDIAGSLEGWDGISNMVRHYPVSTWILEHYHPVAAVNKDVVYVPNETSAPLPSPVASQFKGRLTTSDLYFDEDICDWGRSLSYLDVARPDGSSSVAATVRSESGGVTTVAPPPGHVWADYRWAEFRRPGASWHSGRVVITDDGTGGNDRRLAFSTTPAGGLSYMMPAGACSQWHGYGAAPLHLTHDGGTPPTVVRLTP